jgi:hypothetical protein
MRKKGIENCAHDSLTYSTKYITDSRTQYPVVICSDCGETIGVLFPDISKILMQINENLVAINNKLA